MKEKKMSRDELIAGCIELVKQVSIEELRAVLIAVLGHDGGI